MKRREFITLLGGAAVGPTLWPCAVHAQQPVMPVIGFLNTRAPGEDAHVLVAFHKGLKETGFVEGQNVAIEYRFAENQYDRLPALAADLVRRQVAVIVAGGIPSAPAAKAATATIPIVFATGADPVKDGLVASLNRPGGNLTGVVTLSGEVGPKRLEMLHELIPTATFFAALFNPTSPITETLSRDLRAAASTRGLKLHILHASNESDFEAAFATVIQLRASGLVIGTDPFFNARATQLAALTVRHAVPAIYQFREFIAAGGLMSYGNSLPELYRQVGVYAGRILKGEKPADLPVQQSTKVELIVNLKTARAIGIDVPTSLLLRADEVIE